MRDSIENIITLFLEGDLQAAETRGLAILTEASVGTYDIEDTERLSLCTVLAMLLILRGSIPGALSWVGACRDAGWGDILTAFLARLCTKICNNHFVQVRGKELPTFDLEIVYTTEDEISVNAERRIEPPTQEKSLAMFWRGFVGEDWETVKSEYKDIDDEFVQHYMHHVGSVMSFNNQMVAKIGDKVLEIGSGRGKIAYMMYKKGLRGGVTLVEINGKELRRSREYLEEFCEGHTYDFVEGDAMDVGEMFRPKSFDVIVAADIVEHMYNNEFLTMLKGVYSILKDGGRFYIQTPDGIRYFGMLEKNSDGLINQDEFNTAYYPHVSEKSIGYLKQTLTSNGFSVRVIARGRILIEARKI